MNEYIKSPLNYHGGKYKILNQIIPLFPSKINKFVDLFGGGFNVGINVHNCEEIIYNDTNNHVVEILRTFGYNTGEDIIGAIEELIESFKLSKTNKDGFLELRKWYNEMKSKFEYTNFGSIVLYTLICYSFNNQIRFNSKGEFNMPFGKNKSSFNPTLKSKFIKFIDELHKKNVEFFNMDFIELITTSDFSKDDFIYCDPPYFGSVATYNENDGWSEENEKTLLDTLDLLNEKGIRFALSNNLKYENPLLDKWKDKYNIHYLNSDYSNCNYQKKDKSKDCEVLITNY